MTPVVDTGICRKETFSQKKVFFLLISLHLHLIDHIRKLTIVGKKFPYCFIHLSQRFFYLIFHFKHVLREVGRKLVVEPVFSMDRGFKAQLSL